MISLDIVNLFTNIPISDTIEIVREKLDLDKSIKERTNVPIDEIIDLINFCMMNTSFSFDGKFFQQKSGAPMGSNLSPIIAEALVSKIFELAIDKFEHKPKFLKFFVDDSFLIINNRFSQKFLDHINRVAAVFKTIKFTIETETNNELAFLDLKVIRKNSRLETTVYRKPTHSNRYLNFRSHHSLQNKKSVIRSLVYRAFTHCSNSNDLSSELDNLKFVLNQNNYPDKIIHEIINQYRRKFSNSDSNEKIEFDINRMISIPYHQNLSENIRRILGNHDIKVVFKKGKTIRNMLNPIKKPIYQKSNVVYNVECKNCDSVYVGTTKRKLIDRLFEHKKALKKTYVDSNIAEHSLKTNHEINFENTKISYFEKKDAARKFLESWDIEKHKISNIKLMNNQQNSHTCIPPVYLSLLKNK
jgi:hypothetical protein